MSGTMPTVLATIFFVLAFLWFLIAVAYALSVVLFLKMRREGRLLNVRVDDPTFGRYYFCNDRFYLPMGWIFRRFIVQYQAEQDRKKNNGRSMTKTERRQAMQILLRNCDVKEQKQDAVHVSLDTTTRSDSETSSDMDEELGTLQKTTKLSSQKDDSGVDDEPDDQDDHVCSICLGPYRNEGSVWTSSVCNHKFHRGCLLDWLSRPGKNQCPCCRVAFVEEDDVWKTVKRQRRNKARAACLQKTETPDRGAELTTKNGNADVEVLSTETSHPVSGTEEVLYDV